MRSLTSQKGNENDTVPTGTGQRNGGRRQPSASNISGKGRHSDHGENNKLHQNNDTYGTQIQKNNEVSPRGEDHEGNFMPTNKAVEQNENKSKHNVRASISKEVTTANPQNSSVQPRQTSKKFDNCVTKFAFATKTGYSPKNPNKVNQDSFLVLPHLGEYRRTHFFAVADGHGINGKLVSDFVKTMLAKEVEQNIKYTFDQAKINQRVVDSTEVKE